MVITLLTEKKNITQNLLPSHVVYLLRKNARIIITYYTFFSSTMYLITSTIYFQNLNSAIVIQILRHLKVMFHILIIVFLFIKFLLAFNENSKCRVLFLLFYILLCYIYRIVTGVNSKIVVTLSRKADTMALNAHNKVISGHIFPFAVLYACQ